MFLFPFSVLLALCMCREEEAAAWVCVAVLE